MLLLLSGMQNSVLMSYVPDVVAYPVNAALVKFLPCWVRFCAKVMASRLVCGTAMLKMPVRAEMVTGTVVLTHCFAAAKEASAKAGSTTELSMMDMEIVDCNKSDVGRVKFRALYAL